MPKQITQARAMRKQPSVQGKSELPPRVPTLILERPDWLLSTPQIYYALEAMPAGFRNSEPERIDLTAQEYETLKTHLAKLRGYAVPEVAHA